MDLLVGIWCKLWTSSPEKYATSTCAYWNSSFPFTCLGFRHPKANLYTIQLTTYLMGRSEEERSGPSSGSCGHREPAWLDTGSPRCDLLSRAGRPTQSRPASSWEGSPACYFLQLSLAFSSESVPGLRKRRLRSLLARILGSDALLALTWQNLLPCSCILFPSQSQFFSEASVLVPVLLTCLLSRSWAGANTLLAELCLRQQGAVDSPFTLTGRVTQVYYVARLASVSLWVMGTVEYTSTEGKITVC